MIKKIISVLLLVGSHCYGQGLPVIDISHIAATVANGTVLKKTRDIAEDIRLISGDIRHFTGSIQELQYEIREATLVAESVRDLLFADHDAELAMAASISLDPAAYLDPNTLAQLPAAFTAGYRQLNPAAGATLLQEAFDFDLQAPLPDEVRTFDATIKDKMVSQMAFEEMSAKKAILIGLQYNQLSEGLIAKAIEINALVKQDGRFSMTEAERLALLNTANDYVVEAIELRLRADALIQQQIEKSHRNSTLMQLYKNNLRAKKLTETHTFK